MENQWVDSPLKIVGNDDNKESIVFMLGLPNSVGVQVIDAGNLLLGAYLEQIFADLLSSHLPDQNNGR